jgi:hypothetical protein
MRSISRIKLISCVCLFGVIKVNPMAELSHITFDGCQHVSLAILISLLQRENDLNMLRLWNCPQVYMNKH